MASVSDLVSAAWLARNLSQPGVKVLDGTWIMPGENPDLPSGFIPGAQYFDIDKVADLTSPFKHMLPSPDVFETSVSEMGISNSDIVIIYDRHGFRSAPRLWWTFRVFGHKKVAILDGGLPGWMDAGFETSASPGKAIPSNYKSGPPLSGVKTIDEIKALLGSSPQILDARSSGRFYGTAPEPRAGLRSGHIPESLSWPFSSITENKFLRPLEDARAQIEALGIDLDKPIITTCGSGITAAGLAFTLHRLGAKDVNVYDGSWTEWGASTAPVSLED